jgi:hypothetical protein
MNAANNNPAIHEAGHDASTAGLGQQIVTDGRYSGDGPSNLTLVCNSLALADPEETPNAEWDGAMMQLFDWLNLDILRIPQERSQTLRQRARWPWGNRTAPEAPVFAPWLSHSCLAFQDPRGVRELFPARWVASYLWDPCAGRLGRTTAIDVMLASPHPAACRLDEDACASLPGNRLLQDMIGAVHAEGRSRVAVIGYERSRSVTARQLLAIKPTLPGTALDLEVLTIEETLPRLAANPACWDAIIVLPELRSLVFAMLTELSGIRGPWPMVWHSQGLAIICGETARPAPTNGPLDAALLAQALALAARGGANAFAARRLSESWARLRDRGVVTPTRGSPAPYATQVSDADVIARLCDGPAPGGRSVAAWKAMNALAPEPAADRTGGAAARLALVRGR